MPTSSLNGARPVDAEVPQEKQTWGEQEEPGRGGAAGQTRHQEAQQPQAVTLWSQHRNRAATGRIKI